MPVTFNNDPASASAGPGPGPFTPNTGTNAAPTYSVAGDTGTGWNALGSNTFQYVTSGSNIVCTLNSSGLTFNSFSYWGGGANSGFVNRAGGVLAMYGITTPANAQTLEIYNTTDSGGIPSNYERLEIGWLATANLCTLGVTKGGTGTQRSLQIDAQAAGNVVLGNTAALATNATTGWSWMRTSAGAPSGVPSPTFGSSAPFQYDTTNNKLWVYNGAWKGVALA